MKKIGNAIKIDRRTGLIDPPSLILMSRSLSPLGKIGHYESLTLSLAADGMDEVSLDVHEYNNGKRCPVWDELTNLRLLKVGDLGVFEISVTFTDGGGSVKSIHGVSLEAELALAMLHEFHVNDDEAIEAATDYSGDTPSIESFTPTTLYNAEDPSHSLLHRVFREYAPHWRIGSVTEFVAPDTSSQPTLSSQFQRTYTADGISVYDFLTGEVAQESNVAFTFGVEEYEGRLTRTVHCHSLCDCIDQETGRLLSEGIGEDTSILISKKKLANEISVSPNTDLLKNCFHIEGGDDVITSLVRIASPGGENRIYQFSGLQYDDMTEALRQRLDRYQAMMSDASVQERYAGDGDMDAFFQGSLTLAAPSEGDVAPTAAAAAILTLCQDRNVAAADASVAHLLSNPYWRITGEGDEKRLSASKQAAGRVMGAMDALGSMGIFPRLCLAQGVLSYLTSSMMPGASPAPGTSKEQYEAVLKALKDGPIASAFLPKKAGASHSSVTNSVRAYAQAFLDARFALEVIKGSTSYERQDGAPDSGGGASTGTWKGKIRIRRRSDKGDAFPKDIQAAEPIQVHVTSDKRTLTSQKLIKELSKNSMRDIDFAAGGLNGEELRDYFRQFSLRRLEGIREGYNACLSILIELGLEKEDIYQTYHERFAIVGNENPTDKEMESQEGSGADRRQRGVLEERSAQVDAVAQAMAALEDEQRQFQESHNFRAFLGEDLYKEFCNYLREDTYRNECYVSDGLSTTERLKTARELLDAAAKELGKASSLQRTVSTSLNSLFALPEFEPLYEKLALYSRIRVQAGDETLSLRLIGIDLSGPSLNEIHVTFADHVEAVDGTADSLRGLLKQAGGMAASYPSTLLQAKQGQEARDIVAEMYSAGLNAAKTKLMNNENNDVTITQSGILCRHLDDEGRHSDKQFRITGNIMAFTNNNWESVSLAIGETAFPDLSGVSLGDLSDDKTGSLPMKTAYGIVAENIVGKMMMSDKLFIGNEEGTVQITGKGIRLSKGVIEWDKGVNAPEIYQIPGLKSFKDKVDAALKASATTEIGSDYVISPKIAGGYLYIKDTRPEKNTGLSVEINPSGIHELQGQNTENVFCISKDDQVIMGVGKDGNGIFKGNISAEEGTIAGFNISKNSLCTEESTFNDTKGIFLGKEGLRIGNSFRVSNDETLYMANGDITYDSSNKLVIKGEIQATKGTFSGEITSTATISGGAISGATISGATISGGAISGATISGTTISGGTIYGTHIEAKTFSAYKSINMQFDKDQRRIPIFLLYPDSDSATLQLAKNIDDIYQFDVIPNTTFYNDVWIDNPLYTKDIYARKSIYLDSDEKTGVLVFGKDNAYHYIIGYNPIPEKDGCLLSYVGMPEKSSKMTRTSIRGNTVSLASAGSVTPSDERLKNSFKALDEFDSVFMDIEPCAFKFNNGTSGRFHFGVRAQNIKEAFLSHGYSMKDFGGFVQMTDSPENEDYCGINDPMGIIYTEFTMWNTHMIQKLYSENKLLKQRMEELEKNVSAANPALK